MNYLEYVSNEDLKNSVKYVLDKAIARKKQAEKKLTDNVIDPFGILFESAAFEVGHDSWKRSEINRQCQKTLQNHIGDLHQKILGCITGWENFGVGSVVDLVCEDKKIIAEIKNKYNTGAGGELAYQYQSLDALITPKTSKYRNYTAYFVNIIPKNPVRYDLPFTPSDRHRGTKCQENPRIRKTDGATFYSLATGRENALMELYVALPRVIEGIFREDYGAKDFRMSDECKFSEYFSLAYGY